MSNAYFIIYDFMTNPNGLNLSGNTLNVYALIYSFTKQHQPLRGNASYVAKRCNINRSSAQEILQKLRQKGYIYRFVAQKKGAMTSYDYYAFIFPCDNILGTPKKDDTKKTARDKTGKATRDEIRKATSVYKRVYNGSSERPYNPHLELLLIERTRKE